MNVCDKRTAHTSRNAKPASTAFAHHHQYFFLCLDSWHCIAYTYLLILTEDAERSLCVRYQRGYKIFYDFPNKKNDLILLRLTSDIIRRLFNSSLDFTFIEFNLISLILAFSKQESYSIYFCLFSSFPLLLSSSKFKSAVVHLWKLDATILRFHPTRLLWPIPVRCRCSNFE